MTSIMDGKMGDAIMKYSNILLVAAAIAATACAKEIVSENENTNQPEVKLYPMTFSAGADDGSAPDTKVTLEGKSVLWSATDKIKVFDGTEKSLEAFEITSGEGTTSAIFSGSVADPSATTYYALYPYQESATFHSSLVITESATRTNAIKATIPTEQIAVAGSMPSNAFLSMAASNSEGDFSFKNALSLVKFQIKDTYNPSEIESISLSGNALEYIAGNVGLYLAGDGVNIDYIRGEAESYVTLKGSFESGKDYFFAIRPVTFEKGITLTVKYKDGSCKYASSAKAAQALSRNSVLNLGSPTLADGLPNDLYIAYLHGCDIDVAETTVNKTAFPKATLIKTNGKTGDGLYFVDPSLTVSLETTSAQIVIGRFSDKKSSITKSSVYYLKGTSNNDYLLLKNLELSLTTSAGYHFGSDTDNTVFEKVGFDNCKMTIAKDKALVQSTGGTRLIDAIIIKNCDIKFEASSDNTKERCLMKGSNRMTTVSFENNILYAEEDVANFYAYNNVNGVISNGLKFNCNTVVNLYPAATYAYNNAKTATSEGSNNLFYIPKYETIVVAAKSNTDATLEAKYTGIVKKDVYTEVESNFKDNYAIYNSTPSGARLKCGYGTKDAIKDGEIASVSKEKSVSDQIMNYDSEHFDVVNGIFIPLVSTYGAQRTQTGTQSLSERQTWTGASGWTF
ncbi:MAG: hypothetical protein ACI3ZS_06240 [Candidatus Cryptobacteroides sp.]